MPPRESPFAPLSPKYSLKRKRATPSKSPSKRRATTPNRATTAARATRTRCTYYNAWSCGCEAASEGEDETVSEGEDGATVSTS
jgi:hypothetical protein